MKRFIAAALLMMLIGSPLWAQEIKSVKDVHDTLKAGPLNAKAAAGITQFVQQKYKDADLSKGAHNHLTQKTDDGGGYGFLCLRAPKDAKVNVTAENGRVWPMTRVGDSDLWVWAEKFPNFSAVHYRYEVNGKRFANNRAPRFGFESYEWLPDSLEQPGVPKGKLIEMGKHVSTKHFPGSERNWWIYVPAQYDPSKAKQTKLIVFNDGQGFIKGDGNACTVLDNLIHKGKVPLTIAVFAEPGEIPSQKEGGTSTANRGNEYDTCTPRFANFLDEELLPIVREKYPFSDDPWDHAICGSSSGGSCAFTAAWHRNDLFRRVISFVGSFCDFRPIEDYPQYGVPAKKSTDAFGPWKIAHDYPGLIRKTSPRKEIKVFLQDGENDLDNRLGNWPLANKEMGAALSYSGYDYKLVFGGGMHSKRHGQALLPEILVWIWSDEKPVGK